MFGAAQRQGTQNVLLLVDDTLHHMTPFLGVYSQTGLCVHTQQDRRIRRKARRGRRKRRTGRRMKGKKGG